MAPPLLDYLPRFLHEERSWQQVLRPALELFKFEAKADECFNKLAGLPPPHQKVKQLQEWEELMKSEGEPVFWNPQEILEV